MTVASKTMQLNLGPQHPATHGVLRVELRTDGEVVKAVNVTVDGGNGVGYTTGPTFGVDDIVNVTAITALQSGN